jgi:DNA-binding response OmpR family regulator
MESGPAKALPPRILVIMDDQWPRALLRAGLLDAGYDAVGARSVSEALSYTAADQDRGPVRMVVADRHVLAQEPGRLSELMGRYGSPMVLLLTSAGELTPEGPWTRVMHRPVSIGELIGAVQELVPLASTASGSID